MDTIRTRRPRRLRRTLGSAVLLSVLSLVAHPIQAAHLPAGRASVDTRSMAMPAEAARALRQNGAGPAATWALQAELSKDTGFQNFGAAVAISGDLMLVGAPAQLSGDGPAYVYVFTRSGTTWTQQARLSPTDNTLGDQFGSSVALSGDTALIGAPSKNGNTGVAYAFVRSGTTWTQQAEITATDGASGDGFGSVSLSGDTAVIGAFGKNNGAGAAYVFVRHGTRWIQQQELTAGNSLAGDLFGITVSLSGNSVLIGAYLKYQREGAAYVFVHNGATWTQQAELIARFPSSFAQFGSGVALSGDTALIGAPQQDVSGTIGAGAAYVFVRSGTTWTQQATLTAGDGRQDNFGQSVALNGDTLLVGAPYTRNLRGAVFVFVHSGTTWTPQARFNPTGCASGDYLGSDVALSGNTAVSGSGLNNSGCGSDPAGALWVYVRNSSAPTGAAPGMDAGSRAAHAAGLMRHT